MALPETTIPKGSWVLVTGATGFVAGHVAREFLRRGYRVRGTVRDLAQASWLVEEVFKDYADRGEFELAVVPDITAPENPFVDAVKGVSAIAHVATVGFDPDPHNSVPQTVRALTYLLDLALQEPMMKQFVYTSSIGAMVMAVPGFSNHLGPDAWNETAVRMAWAPPPYDASRVTVNYFASKVETEQALWKFVTEKKPQFQVNSVVPGSILGEPLNKKHVGYPYAFVKVIFDGNKSLLTQRATIHVDVIDVAVLHVAAVLDPDVSNARILAIGEFFNWNDILAIMRRLYPQRKFMEDLPDQTKLSYTVDLNQGVDLLRKWGHQDRFKTLEESVAENMEGILKWYA